MSVQTQTLADFLLARIAEDEAVARAATDPERPGIHWHWVMDATDTPVAHGHLQRAQDDGESVSLRTVEEYPTRNGWSLPHFVVQSGQVHGAGGEHVARWDPARVLAECEAKRRIVQRAHMIVNSFERTTRNLGGYIEFPDVNRREKSHAYNTLYELAAIYADHPDYQQEWRS